MRKLGINVIVMVAFFAITLIIVEIGLRIFWKGYIPGKTENILYAYDDTLGWKGFPKTTGQFGRGGSDLVFHYNSTGFRDDEFLPLDSLSEKRRIVLLGDSYIEGVGLQKNERVGEVLESLDSTISTINFGISGYSTDQEVLVLEKFGPTVKPDRVFLFFCLNDLFPLDSPIDHGVEKPYYYLAEDGKLILRNVPVPKESKLKTGLKRHFDKTALGQLVIKVLVLTVFKESHNEFVNKNKIDYHNISGTDLDSNYDSAICYALLEKLKSDCSKLGASLTVITVPSSKAFTEQNDGAPAEINALLDWCSDLNIQKLDLYPYFRQEYLKNGTNLFLDDNLHWNAAGNRLAAEVIRDQVLNQQP